VANCAHCGTWLAPGTRFCPHCGRRAEEPDTRVLEVPPDETGSVPVNVERTEPRLYGVTPMGLALVLGVAALAGGIVLIVIGHWPFGLILIGLAILLVLVSFEAARRRPAGRLRRSTTEAVEGLRSRAGVAADSVATRGRAARQLMALRRELERMSASRSQLLLELGDAVYRGDEQASQAARERLEELDRLAAQREVEMQQVVETTRDRLAQRRLEVQPTEVVEPQEPAPAPGEGNPPEPARIPEPYPPPDEGNPPEPAVIPEPGPAVIPERGPQGVQEEQA
jgi:hypothetical protein